VNFVNRRLVKSYLAASRMTALSKYGLYPFLLYETAGRMKCLNI
jgi:hypothetical protein